MPEPAAGRAAALRAAADRLREQADVLADLIVREVGKPVGEARAEVARGAAILDYYAQACLAATGELLPPSLPADQPGLLYTERRPRGAAGLLTPWNFPLAIPLWKAAPALATGNAVLLKPSPDAMACGEAVQRLFDGLLPDGLLQVVQGGPETGRAVVAASDVVSFTGSAPVGAEVVVAAARAGLPVQAEMGGQNAAVVLPDADPGPTAALLAGAAMGYAGQKCTATRRIVVVGDPAEFTEALVAAVEAVRVGDPADPAVAAGPVISAAARTRMRDAVTAAREAGARVLTGAGPGPGTASSSHRCCWTASTRPIRWPRRRPSARWRPCCPRRTWPAPSSWPTACATAWSPRCTAGTSGRCCTPYVASTPAWSGSTRRPPGWTSTRPSAARRRPATARASKAPQPWTSTPPPGPSPSRPRRIPDRATAPSDSPHPDP